MDNVQGAEAFSILENSGGPLVHIEHRYVIGLNKYFPFYTFFGARPPKINIWEKRICQLKSQCKTTTTLLSLLLSTCCLTTASVYTVSCVWDYRTNRLLSVRYYGWPWPGICHVTRFCIKRMH